MKKILCISIICFLGISFSSKCQTIPNGGFETWNLAVYYQNPVPYLSSNPNTFFDVPLGNVTRSTDSYTGSYAAHLQTVNTNGGLALGAIYFGDFASGGVNGGLPFVGHPDSVSAYFKFDIMPGDTAQTIIALKKNGAIIGLAMGHLTGTHPSYSKYSLPISWSDTAQSDTLAVMISCSNFNNPVLGSQLYIDNASFHQSANPYPNGDFENWNTVGNEEPDSWRTLNSLCNPLDLSVTKSTDSYEGTNSIKIKSVSILGGDTLGYITNGNFPTNNGVPSGGMPVALNPQKVSGYYKYIPVGADTAFAGIFLYRWNSLNQQAQLIDSMLVPLLPTASFAYFEIPISYNGWPLADTLNIAFTANNNINNVSYIGLGSTLYIDALQLTLNPLGINPNIEVNSAFEIYPNPSDDVFYIHHADFIQSVEIFDFNGKRINDFKLDTLGKNASLQLGNHAKGLYYVRINGDAGRKLMLK
ncbi:MAG: T9SS type A sorting domain-containing protein [Bacteroidota bacterium]